MTLEREELTAGWTAAVSADAGAAAELGSAAPTLGAGTPAAVPEQPAVVPGQRAVDRDRVGHADWLYRCRVDTSAHGFERVDLVADGLDTVAQLALDGVPFATTRNMHRRYRFDLRRVTMASGASDHELSILFESPYREAGRLAARFGTMPGSGDEPFPYLRTMASAFRGPWGPGTVSSGPWRPIAIERWSTARIDEVRPLVDVDAGEGVLDAHVRIERSGPLPTGESTGDLDRDGEIDDLVIIVTVSGHGTKQRSRVNLTAKEDEAVVTVRIPEAALWWPHGYGEPSLYDVEVVLQTVDGEALDRRAFRSGFRSVRLVTEPDADGRPFALSVNATPIDVRGITWIPVNALVSQITPDIVRDRLQQAVGANANLVRVWGGGVYESSSFYETCDEYGLLVWQDFAFVGAAYPEGEPLRGEVIAEARDVVARLARHPSLVVWCGGAESLWLHDRDAWSDELGEREWGLGYFLDLLPTIVAEVDPSRPFTPSTPWPGDETMAVNDPANGTVHAWAPWLQRSDRAYRDSVPRFVTEFGWPGPADWRTAEEQGNATRPFDPDDPMLIALVPRFAPDRGDLPTDPDRLRYLAQLQQTRAIATAVEHWRTHWPRNTGSVLWHLADRPGAPEWAAIDAAGRAKPVLHELRRLYDDTLVTIRPRAADGGLEVAVRSTRRSLNTVVRVRQVDLAGAVLTETTMPVTLDRPGVAVLPVPEGMARVADTTGVLVVADMDWRRATWTPAPDHAMRWRPAEYRATLRPDATGATLLVEATTLIRDLLVQPDRVTPDGRVNRGFMTLLPGEVVDFRVDGVGPEHAEALLQAPALLSLDRVLGTA